MSKIKLVIINDMLWGGGRERRIVRLLLGLYELDKYELHLILLDDRVDYPEIFNSGINVHFIKRTSPRDLNVYWGLYKLMKSINPDVISPWSFMSVAYVGPIALFLGIRCVGAYVVDANPPNLFSVNWVAKIIGNLLCERIISNSLAGHKAYKTPKNKRLIIRNGIDVNKYEIVSKDNKSEAGLIAMVGRVDAHKDYKTYIDAVKILLDRGYPVRALVIGKGDMELDLQKYANLMCGNRVEFMGFRRNVEKIMACCSVGVLCTNPSFHAEGISNALLEFMALSIPVVATVGGGTDELVIDGETGFLVNPLKPVELADKLMILLGDDNVRLRLGCASKKRVHDYFSIERMVLEFDSIYASL